MMFSINPFPHLTSTTQDFQSSNSFVNQQQDDHHRSNTHNPFLSGDCFPAKKNFTTSKHDLVVGPVLEQCDEYNHLIWSEIKKHEPSKKDHHSKIHTSKGPRDRRVRLSIEVAKKFFYLQDLLEVDKASKTLDWLFSKSKISIVELIKRKKESSSSSLTDRSEDVFLKTGSSDEQDKGRNKKSCVEGKRNKKINQKYKSRFNQSRTEARARARARTKEKLNIKNLDNESKTHVLADFCSSSFWSSIDSQQDYDGSITDDKISTLYSYQQNLVVSNDSSSKFTGLHKFADLHEQRDNCARFRSIEGLGQETSSCKDLVINPLQ